MTSLMTTCEAVHPDQLAVAVAAEVFAGGRFAGLLATGGDDGGTRLRALTTTSGSLRAFDAMLSAGSQRYPAVTPMVPGAFWYEREIHDLFGLIPDGHPRLDPLVFPSAAQGDDRPCPGRSDGPDHLDPSTTALTGYVKGEGVFTISYGPVRSGVFETVEYLVETFGEDILQVRVRPYLKHRGVTRRFCGLDPSDGVLLAERVEGTMSLAHAAAFCQAIEALAGVEPPGPALLVRVLHAELERVAHHLDSMIRHCEGAGQAVAYSRLSWHKERVLRLQAALCGNRFGRGIVVLGGVARCPLMPTEDVLAELSSLESDVARDLRSLMTTPSFLDRLRATGVVPAAIAAAYAARGPVGRASSTGADVRIDRPYGGYRQLGFAPIGERAAGDALARQWIRVEEIAGSWHLIRQSLDALSKANRGPWRVSVPVAGLKGTGVSWSESPQGELIYVVDLADGHLVSAKPLTASFHNFALFPRAFTGDIFTDFVFIEASFGVNLAGVAG